MVFSAMTAQAATLEVDDSGGTPYATIQSAIDAATPGTDDVFVHCGTYVENVVMRDQVSVRGAGPGCTTIDGGAAGSAVTFLNVGDGTVLQGFSIRNGLADFGGGIYAENSSPTITGNVIRNNATNAFGNGGGLFVAGAVTAAITAPTITRNVIVDNSAEESGGGISIYYEDGTLVSDNLIKGNTAKQDGGGVHVFDGQPQIVNNTIVDNCIQGAGPACDGGGGGVRVTFSDPVELIGNVIVGNEAAIPGDGGGVDVDAFSSVTFLTNDTWSNQPQDYGGVADPTGVDGNISTDPLFVDEQTGFAGYQPRSDSPLVDAATTAAAAAVDLRGVTRPLDGDADGTPDADIGARESEGLTRLRFAANKQDLDWDAVDSLTVDYNLYRGDLDELQATGIYVQDTGTVLGARQWCALALPNVTDLDLPDPGRTFFYLAVALDAVEGSLGFDSTPAERPMDPANNCP